MAAIVTRKTLVGQKASNHPYTHILAINVTGSLEITTG